MKVETPLMSLSTCRNVGFLLVMIPMSCKDSIYSEKKIILMDKLDKSKKNSLTLIHEYHNGANSS